MSTVEQELAATFRAVAEEAPADLGLVAGVRARLDRRRQRRRAGALLAAAAVGVAAALVLLPGGRDSSLSYAHDPGSFLTANTARATFPFTPGYVPPVLRGVTVGVDVAPTESSLTWLDNRGGATRRASGVLQVVASSSRPDVDPGGATASLPPHRQPVQVRGRAATMSCDPGGAGCRVSWQESSGQWLRVDYSGDAAQTSEAETLAVAQGLQTRTFLPPVQIRIGLVPRGCGIKDLTLASLELGGSPSSCAVAIGLVADLHYPGTPTTYGGRPALDAPSRDPALHQVFVRYPGTQWAVSVLVPSSWDRPLLDALVRSITVPR